MPQIGGTWVNWQDYLAANQPAAEQMASGLVSDIGAQAGAAQSALTDAETAALASGAQSMDVSDGLRRGVSDATSALDATRDTYGIQALLQRKRRGTGYTPGMSLYDAALTGGAAGSRFSGLRGQYGDLFGGVDRAQGRVYDAYLRSKNPKKDPNAYPDPGPKDPRMRRHGREIGPPDRSDLGYGGNYRSPTDPNPTADLQDRDLYGTMDWSRYF